MRKFAALQEVWVAYFWGCCYLRALSGAQDAPGPLSKQGRQDYGP